MKFTQILKNNISSLISNVRMRKIKDEEKNIKKIYVFNSGFIAYYCSSKVILMQHLIR